MKTNYILTAIGSMLFWVACGMLAGTFLVAVLLGDNVISAIEIIGMGWKGLLASGIMLLESGVLDFVVDFRETFYD